MTITTNPSRDEYISSAGQTVFNYTFKIYANNELDVYVTPAGQQANDATDITTDYVVDPVTIGDENGGFITFNAPLNSGDAVTIVSGMDYDRTVDYQINGDFIPSTVNTDNDRQVSQIKQVLELARKAVVFGQAQQGTSGLTSEAPESGKFIRWKPDLSGFENTDLTDVGSLVPLGSIDIIYPTVALMKADSLNVLEPGITVSTQGYYSAGDGGGATYLIAAPQSADEYGDHTLSNSNVALLEIDGPIRAETFGVLASQADNILNAQAAIDRLELNGGGEIIFPVGDIKFSAPLVVSSSAVIISGQGSTGTFFNNGSPQNRGTNFLYTGAGSEPILDLGNGVNLYSGIIVRDLSLDGQGATGVIGMRLNSGIINSEFKSVHFFDTATGCQVLGTGLITSFNNKWLECTFEHFDDNGLDIVEDGNGSIVSKCKFINSSAKGLNPTASVRAGITEQANSIYIEGCSFGSQNVEHHIRVDDCQGLAIVACEIEASGNSTDDATSLIHLGNAGGGTLVKGATITGNRFLGNSSAANAIRFDDVDGVLISGNAFVNSFTAGALISNSSAADVALFANDYGGGNPITATTGLSFYINSSGEALFGNGVNLPLGPNFTITNVTPDRTYNVNTVTLTELANVVGTLISDLENTGLIQ